MPHRAGVRHTMKFVFAAVAFVGTARADQQTATWLGGSGSYYDPTQWSGGVVPNNATGTTFNVQIDGSNAAASTVTIPYSSVRTINIDSLTIDSGDVLSIAADPPLKISGDVTVNGTLQLTFASYSFDVGGTLGGTGTIAFDTSEGRLGSSSGTLTVPSGLTIRGANYDVYYHGISGYLGSATLVNRGYIVADQPNLALNLSAGSMQNEGSLEARNGGILRLGTTFSLDTIGALDYTNGALCIGGTLENVGRNLQIDNAHGDVWLGGTIHGGTVTTGDGRALQIEGPVQTRLDGVTLNAKIIAYGRLVVPAGKSFVGTADILFPNPQFLEDYCGVAAESGTTTIGPNINIHGGTTRLTPSAGPDQGGVVGNSGQSLLNKGSIRADTANERIFLHGSDIANYGVFEADDGAQLVTNGPVTFYDSSRFIVGGSGNLSVTGDLVLAFNESLDVLPKSDGSSYSSQIIATYTGMRYGIFTNVTPGITVSYTTGGQVRISGVPTPEPATWMLAAGGVALFTRRRVRNNTRGL